jgi:hypothetical protein
MSRAFNNGIPDLVASNITENSKGKAIYGTLVTESAKETNYNGYVRFEDQIGTNYRSYELYREATLGFNLCNDCSACEPPATGLDDLRPEIDTALGPVSGIDLTDVSDNIADISGGYWIIDASNNLIAKECHENVYAHRKVVLDWDRGNDTEYNYLYCYDFPAKISFAP